MNIYRFVSISCESNLAVDEGGEGGGGGYTKYVCKCENPIYTWRHPNSSFCNKYESAASLNTLTALPRNTTTKASTAKPTWIMQSSKLKELGTLFAAAHLQPR